MKQLTIYENTTLDSRDVAAMVGKEHAHLCRDITGYIAAIGQNPDLDSDDFFIAASYAAGTGKQYTRYNITRKGCEFVANKLTGAKGIQFTAKYINRFHEMENGGAIPADKLERLRAQSQADRAKAMLMNAQNRMLKTVLGTVAGKALSPVAAEAFTLKSIEAATGIDMSQYLPECKETHSATDIGLRLGITPHHVGSLANKHGLKTDEYGITVMDKSPHSAKEVPNFRYYANVIPVLQKILKESI